MKTGDTGIEVELTCVFSDDGSDASFVSARVGDREMPTRLRKQLLDWLGERSERSLADEAWVDATWRDEPETDDAACDEARVPGAA